MQFSDFGMYKIMILKRWIYIYQTIQRKRLDEVSYYSLDPVNTGVGLMLGHRLRPRICRIHWECLILST